MRALVTGATGIVGANLVRALLGHGYHVRVLLRPSSDARALLGLTIERWSGDVLDEASLKGAASGCDFVFHAAAVFAYSGYSAEQLKEIAVTGTRNIFNIACAANVQRVILTSSTIILGSSTKPEIRNELSIFDDQYPSAYTLSKVHQEKAAREIADELGLDLVVVCPGLTIGAHDYRLSPSNANIVNYLNDPLRSTFLGGCNLVSARDVASGHILAALHGENRARYILGGDNLHWDTAHSLVSKLAGSFGPSLTLNNTATYLAATVAEASARFMGKKPSVTRDEAVMSGRFFWYSNEAIKQLGLNPVSAKESLAESLAWLIHRAYLNESVVDSLSPTAAVIEQLDKIRGAT